MSHPTRARTLLGAAGTLSSRLQPNHPTDDPQGIAFLTYCGLALGAGDALIGVNPAVDTVENVNALLRLLDSLREVRCADANLCAGPHQDPVGVSRTRRAVEILFQSLAGTETTNLREFDISVELLDHGYRTMAAKGPLRDAPQFMYFETGQGSEFSYGTHHGIDMTTTEALCYGLARRYDPFMVNNVTGFIGPETHLESFRNGARQSAGPFHGQAARPADGNGPLLHAAFPHDPRRPADGHPDADGRRGQLFHGRLPQHRPHAGLFRHERHDVQTLRET